MKFKVKLRLTDSSGTRKKYSINLEEGVKFMVGRGTPGLGSDLSHPSVSSQHCFLSVKDHMVWVTDNQSRNGTFLNQKRVDQVAIKVGDMLQIGDYVIEFLEAPMPAKKDNASTQFIDIAELSAEEQAALKRVGAVTSKPVDATQVLSRSSLFNRSKSIDVPKLLREEAEKSARMNPDSSPIPADAPAAASVPPVEPSTSIISTPSNISANIPSNNKDTMFGELTPMSKSSEESARQSSSIDLAAMDAQSAASGESTSTGTLEPTPNTESPSFPTSSTVTFEAPTVMNIRGTLGGMSPVVDANKVDAIADRNTDEIPRIELDRPEPVSVAAFKKSSDQLLDQLPGNSLINSEDKPREPKKPEEPVVPDAFIPAELMSTSMIMAKRGANNQLESASSKSVAVEESSDAFLELPKIVTKLETSAPFAKPKELDNSATATPVADIPTPKAVEIPAPAAPKSTKTTASHPAVEPIDSALPVANVANPSAHAPNKPKKLPDTPPPPPNAGKKNRASDRQSEKDRLAEKEHSEKSAEEFIAARVNADTAVRPPLPRTRAHGVISAVIAFSSFAVSGSAATTLGGSPLHFWIPPVYGLVGAAMVAGLAWLLNHYNEFMEADGDFRDYHRILALAAIPVAFLGALSHASAMYRLPAYVIYAVIFFNVFMTRFKPLAERFLFLAGSYVASFAFILYVATSWDAIMNSANTPPVPDVAVSDSAPARTPAENAQHPVADTKPAAPTPDHDQPTQVGNQAPVPDNGAGTAANTPAANTTANPNGTATTGTATPVAAKPEADSFAMSELLTAAQQGDAHIVHSLIADKNVNPNTVAENGMTALMYAAYNGHLDVAKALVSSKADVNLRDRQGTTALMWAAYNGKQDMTAYLIQSGADSSARRNDGDTALDIAKRWEHSDAAHSSERAEVVRFLENPAVARAAKVPSDPSVAPKPPTPQTVKVTPPPTHRALAKRAVTSKRAPAAAKKRLKTHAKREKYSATTSDDDDDDSDARARAVKSLKIGQ